MNWIYQIPAVLLLLFWVWKLNSYALTTTIYKYFWPSLFFKIISGLSIGALYYFYYQQGDTIAYFSDAVYLRSFASSYPIEYLKYIFFNEIHSDFGNYLLYSNFAPRAVFFAKIVSIVNLFCFDNYWLTSLFFSLFSFNALFLLCNILINVYKKLYFPAIVSLLFLPGFVFWSSGILKESVVIGCIALILYLTFKWIFIDKKARVLNLVLMLVSILLLWKLKYYFAAILIPALFAATLPEFLANKFPFLRKYTIGLWALIIVFFILFATFSNEALHFEILPEIIYSSYSEYAKNSEPGTYIIHEKLDNTYFSILLSIPKALVSGWFRPWLGESQSLFQFLSTIENFALSILFIFSLKNIPELLKTKNTFVYSAIFFCLITSVLVALSVPNFGSLVRFRTGWLFIFALLILYNNPLLEKVGIFIKKHHHG